MVLKWPPWTGKPQRPVEKSGQSHECQEFGTREKWVKLKTEDHDFCELCGRFPLKPEVFEKHPQLCGLTLTEHLKLWHPNGEILDDLDFRVMTDKDRDEFRIKYDVPKRTDLYTP